MNADLSAESEAADRLAEAIRFGAGSRSVLSRPEVGAAGHIVQRSDLTSRRIVVGQATLILVEEGTKRIRWRGGECVANPGAAFTLQAGERVDISNTPGRSGLYRALWISWSAALLAMPEPVRRRPSPRVAVHAGLGDAFRASFYRAFNGLQPAEGLPPAIAASRLREVLLWLAERGFHFSSLASASASFGEQVRTLLAADLSMAWSMERVADEIATSVPTLRRKLAAEDTSFRQLQQDVRMSHALALLQNTDVPVLEIALATGYASASRFSARFRERFGYLPTDVRGQRRGRSASFGRHLGAPDGV
ncbi:helix-turn-helix transcriptional regulator [Burkholderia sp. 22PA0106]|uniref:helix-turn-helix transcriptional regulator n=1 Tax=Burkholderia sp. 22PA0106 TaxID=3237371 RepID=UPI0039C325D6